MTDTSVELVDIKVRRQLRRVQRGVTDMTDLAVLIGEDMTLAIDDRFRDEVDPDGNPWAALDPKYVAWKQQKGYIPKILQMRGDMRGKVAYQPEPDRVLIGSDTPYTRRQHKKRPFIYSKNGGLGAKDEARVEAIADDYLQDLADAK